MTPAPASAPSPAPSPAPAARTLRRIALPLLACLALYGIDLACAAAVPAAGRAFTANMAVPFDLMVCVPALFYVLVVRRGGLSPLLVLPVIWAGSFVSLQFATPGQFSLLLPLSVGAVAVEGCIAVHELRRFARAYRAARAASEQPLDWFSEAFLALVCNERAARLAGLECTMWYYAAASWRRTPHVPAGYRAFSSHKQSGYVAVVGVMLGVMAVETVAVHLLVARWSVLAACLLTLLSAYTVLWMVADARAVVLNPLLVSNTELVARWGLISCERVPLALVARVGSQEPAAGKRERLNLAAMGAQPCWIELEEPIEVRGLLGAPRTVRAIKVSPDEAAAFRNAVLPRS